MGERKSEIFSRSDMRIFCRQTYENNPVKDGVPAWLSTAFIVNGAGFGSAGREGQTSARNFDVNRMQTGLISLVRPAANGIFAILVEDWPFKTKFSLESRKGE